MFPDETEIRGSLRGGPFLPVTEPGAVGQGGGLDQVEEDEDR